jgi:hypothetical protein
MFHWRARDLDVPVVVSDSDLADLSEPGWTTFLMDEAFWSKCCSARAWTAQTRRSTMPSTPSTRPTPRLSGYIEPGSPWENP